MLTWPTLFTLPDGATTSGGTLDQQPGANETINKVGLSVFYDCIDLSPTAEKQDTMKADRSETDEESE